MSLRHVLLLIPLLLGGCLPSPKIGADLPDLLKGFSESMRWKDYQTAAGYLAPSAREAFLNDFVDDKDLQVVGSEYKNVNIQDDDQSALATYVLEYYHLPSPRLQEWRWRQHWIHLQEKGGKSGTWVIEEAPGELPWKR